nr:hypothetical protein [Tanacetum cinerariifolium]
MPPRMTTRSAGRPAAASRGGGTGGRAGRSGGRTRGHFGDQGDGRTDGQGGQVGGQDSEVNDDVNGVSDFSTIIESQLQNLLPTIGDVRNVIENNDRRVILMDMAYDRRGIRRIGNCLYAFSYKELALIHRISFPGYGVLVRIGEVESSLMFPDNLRNTRKSKANVVADALSRKTRHDSLLVKSLQMVITPDFYEHIKTVQHEAWENGDVNSERLVKKLLLDEAHKSKYSIHPGATKMYYNLKPYYWWSGMKKDIVKYVEQCLTCLQVKTKHQQPYGKLQPLEIPVWKWEKITMDLITKLPKTPRQCDAIWIDQIKERLKMTQDRKKSYADKRRRPIEFQVGDRVMLKVSPRKCVIRFRKRGKLGPRYIGMFKIIDRVGKVAYRLELPEELNSIHNNFHVLQLRKYLVDEAEYVPLADIVVDEKLGYVEEPVEILDTMVKKLRRKDILFFKIRWKHRKELDYM